ncbi:MAG: hypothetical protein HOL15_02845 [Nitrospinaceae bacterium]|nr:hypothetical protein [Nitrospinaceae bacterium]
MTGKIEGLIERPDNLYKWSILNILILDNSVFDNSSLNSAGVLFSEVGYLLGGVITGKTFLRQVWNPRGKESRSFLFWSLGRVKIYFVH